MRLRYLLVVFPSVLMSACELPGLVETTLTDEELTLPATWSSPAESGSPQAWLYDLGDPVVSELVGEALRYNFDLRAAAARIGAADARARIAGASNKPRVDADADATRRGSPGVVGGRRTDNEFDTNVTASWEIDLWDRIANEIDATQLETQAAEAVHASAQLSLAANVASAWYRVVEAQLQVALAQETLDNFTDNLGIVEENYRSGLNSALDVHLERANLAAAKSRLLARRVRLSSKSRLKRNS